jgi:hypothetical protein
MVEPGKLGRRLCQRGPRLRKGRAPRQMETAAWPLTVSGRQIDLQLRSRASASAAPPQNSRLAFHGSGRFDTYARLAPPSGPPANMRRVAFAGYHRSCPILPEGFRQGGLPYDRYRRGHRQSATRNSRIQRDGVHSPDENTKLLPSHVYLQDLRQWNGWNVMFESLRPGAHPPERPLYAITNSRNPTPRRGCVSPGFASFIAVARACSIRVRSSAKSLQPSLKSERLSRLKTALLA